MTTTGWACILCHRTDVFVEEREVRRPYAKPVNEGRVIVRDGDEIVETERLLVCPCCSFEGCPHPKRGALCESCGRPVNPGFVSQCDRAGDHSVAVPA